MIITSQQFNDAYKKLPYVLREYIAEDELAGITEEMGHKYQLHVDTVGALYRETTNMLLGLINPEQFVAELKSVGIPQENISAIVAELNTKIFIPLREKMQHPEEAESDEDEGTEDEVLEQTNFIATPAPMPSPVTAPVITPTPTITAVPAPVNTPIPAVEWVQMTPTAPPAFAPPPQAPVIPAAMPFVETPIRTPEPLAPFIPPVQQVISPQPGSQTMPATSAPSYPQFTPTMPPITPVASTTAPTSPLTPKIQPQKTDNRDALHAVLKEYGVDPYREPPE